jgi:hypothetical protein
MMMMIMMIQELSKAEKMEWGTMLFIY